MFSEIKRKLITPEPVIGVHLKPIQFKGLTQCLLYINNIIHLYLIMEPAEKFPVNYIPQVSGDKFSNAPLLVSMVRISSST